MSLFLACTAICPEVRCMRFCENGYETDENGCDTCVCKEPGKCQLNDQ